MLLTRDQILQAVDLPYEDVDVKEWGGVVRVRGLSGAERDAISARLLDQHGKVDYQRVADLQTRLPAMCMIGGDGERLFSDEDVAALAKKSAVALKRVFEIAQRLSGLSDEDVEEMRKNSGNGRSGGSGSA